MTYTLTTPLYYVNDKPHLGSTYTTVACDALARFQRMEGDQVLFVTGVDEHGQKIQRTAEALKVTPQKHCDQITKRYLDLWTRWRITNDRFIRTTSSRHQTLVTTFFERVVRSGDVYLGRQKGWYCVGCEEYKDETSEASQPICSIHRKPLEWRDEENLFFRLSRYQSKIEKLVAQPNFISPESRRNEVRNFVAQGLRDFSISRVDVSWGLRVPGYPNHTFYVWFDALLGYLSALLDDGGPVELERLDDCGWPATVHVIGKDILRFHAVFWPAMLMSAKLPLPKLVFGHGFLTREGLKMGKSLGNVLDPETLIEQCGSDAVRWYLLRDIKFGQDGDFQQQRFIDLVNNDLANTIGNLLNRTSSMSRKWFGEVIPSHFTRKAEPHTLAIAAESTIIIVRQAMPLMDFQSSAEAILNLAITANGYLNDTAPWSRMKQPGNEAEVADDLYAVLEACRLVGLLLNPLVPSLSERLLEQLAVSTNYKSWHSSLKWGLLQSGALLPEPLPIMQKLELSVPL
ncbi:MAG TPA: methionine--tRNA ligase [Prochlorococcus sp.]